MERIRFGRWMVASLLVACVGFGLAPPAQAFKGKEKKATLDLLAYSQEKMWVGTSPLEEPSLTRALASLEVLAFYDAFLQEHGTSWYLVLDRATGFPAALDGGGIPWIPGSGVGNSVTGRDLGLAPYIDGRDVPVASVESIARDFMKMYPGLFGVREQDLALMEGSGPMLDYLYYLNFRPVVGGIPVDNAIVSFSLNHGNLVLVGQERVSPKLYGLDLRPSISEETAWEVMAGYLAELAPGPDDLKLDSGLLIVPVSTEAYREGLDYPPGEGLDYRLVYRLAFHRPGVTGNWEGRVDAHTGELLSFLDLNQYDKIRGGAYAGDRPVPEKGWPFPYADYNAPTSNQYADAVGNFTGSGTSALNGKYVRIQDDCGSISLGPLTDINFGSGAGTDCTTPGAGGAGNTHASRTQYYNVTKIKMKALTYLPSNTWLQGRLTDNVNIADVCNAYWSGMFGTINFFQSGGGCANTGELPGVSLHEFAHGLDSNDGNGSSPDNGTGETYGDFTAILQTRDSCTGNGFMSRYCGYGNDCTSCTGIRDADYMNYATQKPVIGHDLCNDACAGCTTFVCPLDSGYRGPCGYEGHCESLISTQALWDLAARDLPAKGYDAATSWQIVDRLWYASRPTATSAYTCTVASGCTSVTTAGCTAGTLWRVFRTADDDNGSTADGTPNSTALWAAFNRHLIGCGTDAGYNTDYRACTIVATDSPALYATASNAQVILNWSGVTNATKYYIYRNEAGCDKGFTKVGSVNAPALTFTDTPVINGIYYYYRVLPVGATDACTGAMSNCATVAPLPCTPPAAPASLSATADGDYRIDLSWSSVAGAVYYTVYRGTVNGGPYSSIATVSSGATTHSDTSVVGTKTYYYRVTAFLSCESVFSPQASAIAGGACNLGPNFAGLVSASNALNATCRVDLAWGAGSSNCGGTLTYEVHRSVLDNFAPDAGTLIGTTSGTTYQDTGAALKKVYYYIVRAVDSVSGFADSNTVVRSAYPTGAKTQVYGTDFEGSAPAGWTTGTVQTPGGGTVTGLWEWGDPESTVNNFGTLGQPADDHTASGVNCYTTGRLAGAGAGTYDVDFGEVWLRSASFNTSTYPMAELDLWIWFLNDHSETLSGCAYPDFGSLEVSRDGTNWVVLKSFPEECSTANACGGAGYTNRWTNYVFKLEEYLTFSTTMYVRYRAADGQTSTGSCAGDLVEAALDDFYVYGVANCTSCTAPAVPTGLSATVPAANTVHLSWTGSGNRYNIFRSDGACPGGTFTQIAGNVTTTTYDDATVSGGQTYSYKVTALSPSYCESGYSACAGATATGTCFAPPTFAGLSGATSRNLATCGVALSWGAATASCGGGISYNIYRSTTAGFTPSASNKIASGVSGTSYNDSANLVYGTMHYYVVRAQEGSVEETNLVEKGVAVSGAAQTVIWSDNMDSGVWTDKWTEGFFVDKGGVDPSTLDVRGYLACTPTHSGSQVFKWGGAACADNYQTTANSYFAPSNNVYMDLHIPYDATNCKLSFWHRWSFAADDGALFFANVNPNAGTLYYWDNGIFDATSPVTYNGTTTGNGLTAAAAFTGIQATMVNSIIDLEYLCDRLNGKPCAGQSLTIAFAGNSGTIGTDDGWFVDDVVVLGNYGSPCATAGCGMLVEVTPSSAAVDVNNDITFTANHTGTEGPYTYQWTEGGVNISGANGPTLAVRKASAGTFSYNCKVTDSTGLCTAVTDATPAAGTWNSTCTPPDPPTLVSATGTCSGVDLSWSAGSGTTLRYNLYRKDAPCGGTYAKIAGPVNGTSYSDTAAVAGNTYAYVVRGTCDAGGTNESGDSNCLTAARLTSPTIVYSTRGPLTEMTGDGDGVMEAGEKYSVRVTLQNTGTGAATNVQASLTGMAAGNGIEVCNNPGSYGAIAAGGTANYTYEFVVDDAVWYGTYACGTNLTFNLVSKTATGACPCTCADQMGVFSNPVGAAAGNETATQVTSPLNATNGTANSNLASAFTIASPADTASLSYTSNYTPLVGTTDILGPDDTPGTSALWTRSNVTDSTGAASCSHTTNYALFAGNVTASLTQTSAISTVGYTNLRVRFDYSTTRSAGSMGTFYLDYSVDNGSNWTQFGTTYQNNGWLCNQTATLPSTCEGVAQLKIRFRFISNAINRTGLLDYIIIQGDGGSGDWTTNARVELVGPGGLFPTPIKAYNNPDPSFPMDILAYYNDATYGGPGTYILRLSENAGGTATVTLGSMSVTKAGNCNTGAGSCGAAPPLRVPHSLTPLTGAKGDAGGTSITVDWDRSACASADYHLIYGYGSSIASYTVGGGTCGPTNSSSYSWSSVPDPSGDSTRFLWFLILGDNGSGTEGSWGTDSLGSERHGAVASGIVSCGTAKDTGTSCATP